MLKDFLLTCVVLLLTPFYLFAVPTAPGELSLKPAVNTVSLHWQDNSDTETGFKIFRDGVLVHVTRPDVTNYHDKGLQPHKEYAYKVLATDDTFWYRPESNTSWQWQLSGKIDESYDVDVYDIDLFDVDTATIQRLQASGKKVICYFSAGSYESIRSDAEDFPAAVLGNTLYGWDDEKWLDIRAASVRTIMINRLSLAQQKGCDGVEPDNVNGFTNNTGFTLSAENQLSYNLFLAKEAHKKGLSIGLKNDVEQIVALEPYFDFAVNEQCHFYHECHTTYPFIYANKPVFNAEYEQVYVDNTNGARDVMCKDSDVIGFQTLVLTEDLNNSFRYVCKKPISQATLLFKSGFEGDVRLGEIGAIEEGYQSILGSDVQGFSWPVSLWGSQGSALHYIDHDNYTLLEHNISEVLGHKNTMTKALYNLQRGVKGVTQTPYSIRNIQEGNQDLYIKYWIKMDSKSLIQRNTWRTFFEYKTNKYADNKGFRLIAYLYTDVGGGSPYWHWQGDKNPTETVWTINNRLLPIPMEEWFLTEFYWHWSTGADGRALWKVNGQVVGYYHGPTTLNNQLINLIMLTQIYGNANPKEQWIDDIEIWDGLPPQ